jgi:hypothetical protein
MNMLSKLLQVLCPLEKLNFCASCCKKLISFTHLYLFLSGLISITDDTICNAEYAEFGARNVSFTVSERHTQHMNRRTGGLTNTYRFIIRSYVTENKKGDKIKMRHLEDN